MLTPKAARGGQEQQQAGDADRGGPEAGDQQAGAGAERAHDEAAERERPELRAVAGAVVVGERAAPQRVRDALVDERAQQDVLHAVRDLSLIHI